MTAELIIRALTIGALAGLLGAVGLRLRFQQITEAVRQCRFFTILAVNFLAVPGLCAGVAYALQVDRETLIAMVLLGAAPFAPVVPVFARMARADLALAAGMTSVYPVISALLTPAICEQILSALAGTKAAGFSFGRVLMVLVATITVPILAGMGVKRFWPRVAERLLRPMEIISEGLGAISLAFVTVVEFGSIVHLGGRAFLATLIVFELSLAVGWWMGGKEVRKRRVIALGTSNRNIALALLVAIESFPNTRVVSAVVGNGLVLILLGLIHVGWWRWKENRAQEHDLHG